MKLGDFFPDDLQNFRFNDKIKVGSVLKYFVEDTTPPKYKRMIIIGISGEEISVATVYLNSELNTNVFKNKRMQALQIPIEQEGREYLEHDSYVDCSFLHLKQIDKLDEEFKNNRLESLGEVSEDDLNLIKGTLISASTISIKQKKDYGLVKIKK
jgi:hypothetical protein